MDPIPFLDNLSKFSPQYANKRLFTDLDNYIDEPDIMKIIENTTYISWDILVNSLKTIWDNFEFENNQDNKGNYFIFMNSLEDGIKSEHLMISQLPYKTMNFRVKKTLNCDHIVYIDDFSASGQHLSKHILDSLINPNVYNTSKYYSVKKISIMCPFMSYEARDELVSNLGKLDIQVNIYTIYDIYRWTKYIDKNIEINKYDFCETACCFVCDHAKPEYLSTLVTLYNKIWPEPDLSYKKIKLKN